MLLYSVLYLTLSKCWRSLPSPVGCNSQQFQNKLLLHCLSFKIEILKKLNIQLFRIFQLPTFQTPIIPVFQSSLAILKIPPYILNEI